jgi:hypothetical protein
VNDPFLDRELPQNLQAECAILGAILLDNSVCDQAIAQLTRSDFYLDSNRSIFERVITLRARGDLIDIITLSDELRTHNELERIGGVTYIASLIDGVPRTDTIEPYAKLVKKKAALRALIAVSNEAAARALDADDPAEVRERLIVAATEIETATSAHTLVDKLGCSGVDLSSDETEQVNWIAYGYVALGAVAEIIAKVKAGKTTFVLALIRACLFGGDFLGHYVEPRKVLIVTEQGRVSFKAQASKAGILGSENLTVIFKYELTPFSWEQRVDLVMKKAAKVGAQLIIWDTFSRLACLKDDGENSEEAGRKMSDLADSAAASGLGIVPLRHGRKAGGDVGDAGRGYSGISGAVDIIIQLKESNQGANIRDLETRSRFDETPQTAVIELVGQHYRLREDTGSIRRDRNTTKILDCLPREESAAFRLEEIMNATGLKKEAARILLKDLTESHTISTKGKGVARSPFVWWNPAKVSQNENQPQTADKPQVSGEPVCLPSSHSHRDDGLVDRLSNQPESLYQDANPKDLEYGRPLEQPSINCDAENGVSGPNMITRDVRHRLRGFGESDEAIDRMTPQKAWALIEFFEMDAIGCA